VSFPNDSLIAFSCFLTSSRFGIGFFFFGAGFFLGLGLGFSMSTSFFTGFLGETLGFFFFFGTCSKKSIEDANNAGKYCNYTTGNVVQVKTAKGVVTRMKKKGEGWVYKQGLLGPKDEVEKYLKKPVTKKPKKVSPKKPTPKKKPAPKKKKPKVSPKRELVKKHEKAIKESLGKLTKKLACLDKEGAYRCGENEICDVEEDKCRKLTKKGRPYGEKRLQEKYDDYTFDKKNKLAGSKAKVEKHAKAIKKALKELEKAIPEEPEEPEEIEIVISKPKRKKPKKKPKVTPKKPVKKPKKPKKKKLKPTLLCFETGGNKCKEENEVCDVEEGKCRKLTKKTRRPYGEKKLKEKYEDYTFDKENRLLGTKANVEKHVKAFKKALEKLEKLSVSEEEIEIVIKKPKVPPKKKPVPKKKKKPKVSPKKPVKKEVDIEKPKPKPKKKPAPKKKKPIPKRKPVKKEEEYPCTHPNVRCPDDKPICDAETDKCREEDEEWRKGKSMLIIRGRQIIIGKPEVIRKLQKDIGGEIKSAVAPKKPKKPKKPAPPKRKKPAVKKRKPRAKRKPVERPKKVPSEKVLEEKEKIRAEFERCLKELI